MISPHLNLTSITLFYNSYLWYLSTYLLMHLSAHGCNFNLQFCTIDYLVTDQNILFI